MNSESVDYLCFFLHCEHSTRCSTRRHIGKIRRRNHCLSVWWDSETCPIESGKDLFCSNFESFAICSFCSMYSNPFIGNARHRYLYKKTYKTQYKNSSLLISSKTKTFCSLLGVASQRIDVEELPAMIESYLKTVVLLLALLLPLETLLRKLYFLLHI